MTCRGVRGAVGKSPTGRLRLIHERDFATPTVGDWDSRVPVAYTRWDRILNAVVLVIAGVGLGLLMATMWIGVMLR